MRQRRKKIIGLLLVLCVLAAAYLWGGNFAGGNDSRRAEEPPGTVMPDEFQNPDLRMEAAGVERPAESRGDRGAEGGPVGTGRADNDAKAAPAENLAGGEKQESPAGASGDLPSCCGERGMLLHTAAGEGKYSTDPVPGEDSAPDEPQAVQIEDVPHTCIFSVRCDAILDNMGALDPEKAELVPEDGIIFPAARVTFFEGESVFNLLQREMKKHKIHLEFRGTPAYNSAYIRGINNLYEFDAGELSGWTYKVNGLFPHYGTSLYRLEEGDVVEIVYTCDLGRDVGSYYAAGGE